MISFQLPGVEERSKIWENVFPSKLPRDTNERDALKEQSPVIYTTLTEILETGATEDGETRVKVQLATLILDFNLTSQEREQRVRGLIFKLVEKLGRQRWGLSYVYPTEEIKGVDLHGLLRSPDQIVGNEGWSPTLQGAGQRFVWRYSDR